jgi:pimeloyl-ACP methyl ester esterase
MPFVETADRVNIHYEVEGNGPPLVFIHGWAMSGRVWRFQTEGLSDAFSIVTIDLRGHGRSSAAESYSLAACASDVATVCAHLDLSGVVLVGWSLGSQVALTSVPLLHGRLAALILVGGTPRFTAAADFPYGLPAVEVRGMGVRLKRDYRKTLGEFFRGMFAPGELAREQENRIAREIVMAGSPPEPAAALRTLDILVQADLRPLLPDVTCPSLLIHGSRDTICLPEASTYMAGQLPHAELLRIPGVGHAPFLSGPERFNGVIRAYCARLHAH